MNTPSAPPDIHSEAFLHSLMRRQLRLSIVGAATFLVALLGLPLLNYYFPEAMATRVLGFTLTWFVLGVLFFPFVWIISWVFIRRSIALEEAEVAETKAPVPSAISPANPRQPRDGGGGAVVGLLGLGAWHVLSMAGSGWGLGLAI